MSILDRINPKYVARWAVRLIKPIQEGVYPSGYFPRLFRYHTEAKQLLTEVNTKHPGSAELVDRRKA